MFIYAFLSEGVGQFSFQLTPPMVRPGGRVNVIPPSPRVYSPFAPAQPTQYLVQVFYRTGDARGPDWILNPRHTRNFQSAGEAVSYFNALCEQGRAVGATSSYGGNLLTTFFVRKTVNYPTSVRLSRNGGSGWTVINHCDS